MNTVRRLYFYGLSFISIEVVVWGVIGLLRTVFSSGMVGSSLLATGLSLVLVGLPIFYLHWRTAQRDAMREPDERGSRVRAVFLYAALGAAFGPILLSTLALVNKAVLLLFGRPESQAWFGSDQVIVDHLIAIAINAVLFAYFWSVTISDWRANTPESALHETRRFYRYIWVLVGLTLVVSGVYNLLRYLLYTPGSTNTAPSLAGAIALLLVGVPLWYFFWQMVQEALHDPEERRSLLRLVVLYLISLVGVIGVVTFAGSVLNQLFRWLLGERQTFWEFIQGNSAEIGALIPLAVMWWYYGRILNQEVAALTDQPRRAALRRLYYYILSLIGLAVTVAGLFNLIDYLVTLGFIRLGTPLSFGSPLAGSLASLLVGLPLWLITWRQMQAEADRTDEPGDHARRSVVRKSYLYLVLFAFVIGAMAFAGQFLFSLLDAVLSGTSVNDLAERLSRLFFWLVVDVVLLVYHFRTLRQDGKNAQQSLGNLHSDFPTLVLVEEEQEYSRAFGENLVAALGRIAPRLPVAVYPVERGAPDESMLGAKAVLIPVGTAMRPPDALRLWLEEYRGKRLLVPVPDERWSLLGQAEKNPNDLSREAAQAVRQMAEGEAVRQIGPSSPWAIAGYVLGGFFGLILLIFLFSMMMSLLFR